MTLDEMTIRPPAWLDDWTIWEIEVATAPRNRLELSITDDGEYLLELENGYGVLMWTRLDNSELWEVEIVTVGPFGVRRPASSTSTGLAIGRWPWQMSGLTAAEVEQVQADVLEVDLRAVPMKFKPREPLDPPKAKRTRKRTRKGIA